MKTPKNTPVGPRVAPLTPLTPRTPRSAASPTARIARLAVAAAAFVVGVSALAISPVSAADASAAASPADAGASAAAPRPASVPASAKAPVNPARGAALAAALADLGLRLLREQGGPTAAAPANAVLSPLGLSTALGLLHAGSGGNTARELAALLDSTPAGARAIAVALPEALQRLAAPQATAGPALAMASRVWLSSGVAQAVSPTYTARAAERYGADGAVLSFRNADAARLTINQWVSAQTAQRIPDLMPAGSIKPTTRLVVTNAMFFKSPWAQPFDASKTVPKPFRLASGASRAVPTMVGEHTARHAVIDQVTVYELPFAGGAFNLTIALPAVGQTLADLQRGLSGAEVAGWSRQLLPVSCRLELPRFRIAPASRSLKPALQSMGLKTAFTEQADFSPLLGPSAERVRLSDVFHASGITIDEQGGEAVSASGAAVQAKSFTPPMACAVDRAFLFVVSHRDSGLPLFIGQVADPGAV